LAYGKLEKSGSRFMRNKYENDLNKIEFISELESFKEHVYNI